MSLEILAHLGEFLGGAAVVLSLIYLARQVRQNTESLRTENYARSLERVATIQSRLSSDPDLARVFARGVLDTQALSAEERIRFSWAFYEMFGGFEFMFHQARSGALPPDVWERWSLTLAWWLSLSGVRAWWEAKPTPFSRSFSSLVGSMLENNPTDPESAKRWQRFLALGGPPHGPRPPSA